MAPYEGEGFVWVCGSESYRFQYALCLEALFYCLVAILFSVILKLFTASCHLSLYILISTLSSRTLEVVFLMSYVNVGQFPL